MDLTNLQMNITAKIAELNQEILKLSVAKQTAHDRIIELRVQIKKLTTLAKHAEEVFGGGVEENGQPEHLASLQS